MMHARVTAAGLCSNPCAATQQTSVAGCSRPAVCPWKEYMYRRFDVQGAFSREWRFVARGHHVWLMATFVL